MTGVLRKLCKELHNLYFSLIIIIIRRIEWKKISQTGHAPCIIQKGSLGEQRFRTATSIPGLNDLKPDVTVKLTGVAT
jgi:hypothetical protein